MIGPKNFEAVVMQWRTQVTNVVCGPASMLTTLGLFVTLWKVTAAEIASEVGISVGNVHTIFSDELGFRKVSASWVPCLNEAQRNV